MADGGRKKCVALRALLILLAFLPASNPQMPTGAVQTPNIQDSMKLVNILIRRPIGPVSVRKACNLLPTAEFERITGVINMAKRDTRIKPNVYDAFAYLHAHPDINAGAHKGPAFLPFHRVLVFLFEKLMRMYDPTVSLCYWDSTMEPTVSDMAASATWTHSLFGNNQGTVQSGFASGWMTPLGALIRAGGQIGRPFSKQDIDLIIKQNTLGEISFPGGNIDNNLEEKHNYVHTFVGGLMGRVETASYDPIFWFHHTYIDCLYEWFVQAQKAKGIDPMRDWPAEYGDAAHAPFAPMRLGSLRMIDGANSFFSNRTLKCLNPPEKCSSNADCGVYMRCNPSTKRCISDTLSTTPTTAEEVRSLSSLLRDINAASSINSLFHSFASRGFNSIFRTPSLESLTQATAFGSGLSGGTSATSGVPASSSSDRLLTRSDTPAVDAMLSGLGSVATNLLTGKWRA